MRTETQMRSAHTHSHTHTYIRMYRHKDTKPRFTLHDVTVGWWLEPNPPARCCQFIHWCWIWINLCDCSVRSDTAAAAVISLKLKGIWVLWQSWTWQTTEGNHHLDKDNSHFCLTSVGGSHVVAILPRPHWENPNHFFKGWVNNLDLPYVTS